MKIINLFIADDHQLVVDGLAGMIDRQDDMQLLGYANDGLEALRKIAILKPDIVLMDLDMPKMNGLVAAQEVLSKMPSTKVIIISMHSEKGIVEKLITMGVNGYLVKNADQEELLTSIRWIAAGKNYYSPQLTRNVISPKNALSMDVAQNKDTALLSLLSEREKEIIKLIADGCTSVEIADQCSISSRTVETHRKNLMKKLEINNVAGIIRFALKNGLSS